VVPPRPTLRSTIGRTLGWSTDDHRSHSAAVGPVTAVDSFEPVPTRPKGGEPSAVRRAGRTTEAGGEAGAGTGPRRSGAAGGHDLRGDLVDGGSELGELGVGVQQRLP